MTRFSTPRARPTARCSRPTESPDIPGKKACVHFSMRAHLHLSICYVLERGFVLDPVVGDRQKWEVEGVFPGRGCAWAI